MNFPVAINRLSTQLGLTSRTLRHWESEGLFKSIRDHESGWRIYDEESVLCIKITSILRKIGIPLKDIKTILDAKSSKTLEDAIKKQLLSIDQDTTELMLRKIMINNLLNSLSELNKLQGGSSLIELENLIHNVLNNKNEKEDDFMIKNEIFSNNVRIITLPSMRTVYNIALGTSPEDEAMAPVIEWLESSNLMGTARLFGGNVKPYPSKTSPQYGYGMCASIPEGIKIPENLKEMQLPGGLYAVMPSGDDIYGSWQLLMKYLSQNNEYTTDKTRLCLEEHIRNDNPGGQGSQFLLNLLEPVKKK